MQNDINSRYGKIAETNDDLSSKYDSIMFLDKISSCSHNGCNILPYGKYNPYSIPNPGKTLKKILIIPFSDKFFQKKLIREIKTRSINERKRNYQFNQI